MRKRKYLAHFLGEYVAEALKVFASFCMFVQLGLCKFLLVVYRHLLYFISHVWTTDLAVKTGIDSRGITPVGYSC